MARFSSEALRSFSHDVLTAIASPPAHAAVVAEHLAGANLAGHDSHGVVRLVQYRNHVEEGRIDPAATPKVLRETSTTALVDGNLAWGQVVAGRAVEIAVAKARQHAMAAVSVRNCYHIGRVGVYPLEAARAGYVALTFCNGHGVARVAPWGGTEAKLATNPIAIAIPTRSDPILVDITTSVVAEGKVRVAKNAGKPIPEGWVLDREGNTTTDPADLYAGGTLLPFGGREGHKGYGLSVIVDLLGGGISGAGFGFLTETIGNGVLFQVIDPKAFEEGSSFLDRVESYTEYLRSSKPKPGVERILLPGEPETLTAARRRTEGIEIDDGTLVELDALASDVGVAALSR